MRAVRLVLCMVGLLTTVAVGEEEPQIGDSVVVVTEQTEVKSKAGTLAVVPLGTQFIVKQKSGPWLLGQFEIEGQSLFGWVRPSAVRMVQRRAIQQPVYEWNWHNMLLARDKLDDAFTLEEHVEDYMKTARYKVWNQAENDEFQLERKRVETLQIIKKRVEAFDLNRDFMLRTKLEFGTYDFTSKSFPIEEASGNHYWSEDSDGDYPDSLPSRIEVYLVDANMMSAIPMDPRQAERFVAARKDVGGWINRKVYAKIRLHITAVRSPGELEAEVRWAQIFSDRAYTKLLYETPMSPFYSETLVPKDDSNASLQRSTARFVQADTPTSAETVNLPVSVEPAQAATLTKLGQQRVRATTERSGQTAST